MNQENPRGQPFADLVLLQKKVKKELAAQEHFIWQFQSLTGTDEELSVVLDSLNYPVAIFKRGGVLCMVNRTLMEHTDLTAEDISEGRINFTGRLTNENYAMLEAADGVFYGKTALLSRLDYPLSLFCRHWTYSVPKNYHSALFFPLPNREGQIPFGVVILMK